MTRRSSLLPQVLLLLQLLVLLQVGLFCPSAASAAHAADHSTAGPTPHVIKVHGTSSLRIVGDRAEVAVEFYTYGSEKVTMQQVFDVNQQVADKILVLLKETGLPATDIQLNHPKFEILSGRLQVSRIFNVVVHDIAKVDDVVIAAHFAGSDVFAAGNSEIVTNVQMLGSTITSTHFDAAYQRALSLAYENARSKAQQMAEVAGLLLGETISVDELPRTQGMSLTRMPSSNYLGDEIEVEASIAVTFAITNTKASTKHGHKEL